MRERERERELVKKNTAVLVRQIIYIYESCVSKSRMRES